MKKLALFLVFVIFFTFISCDSIFGPSEPGLPKVTTKGANTFGCKIDGKVFVNDFEGSLSDQSLYKYITLYENISVAAVNNIQWGLKNSDNNSCSDVWVNLSFDLDDAKQNILDTAILQIIICEKNEEGEDEDKYYQTKLVRDLNGENSFKVNKFEARDTIHERIYYIFSCKFQGTLERDNGEKIKITDGRFDVEIDERLK